MAYSRPRLLCCRACTTVVTAILALGCSSQPQAPVLRNEPVYDNETQGFRFLTPEGWRQHAKVNVPPGKLEKERLLVQYVRLSAEKGASLDVSMADLPATTDLTAYLAGPSGGVKSWRPKPPIESITINGVPADRFTFTGRVGKEDTTKEVVTIRRGERVYFFMAYFASTDGKAREQVRRAVESTIWKN
jgi:predicted Zn-dependent protease